MTRTKRRPPKDELELEVSGLPAMPATLERWEQELVLAALTALSASQPAPHQEVADDSQ